MIQIFWILLVNQAVLNQQVLNPNLSWIGDILYTGNVFPDTFWMDHPSLEGEMVLQAPVDPFLDGWAVLSFSDESAGVEEAYARTRSRWMGMLFRFGKFRSAFGRINEQHPHQWFFSTFPSVLASAFGPEGLAGTGIRVDYLLPIPMYALAAGEMLGRTWAVSTIRISMDSDMWTYLLGASYAWNRMDPGRSVVGLAGVARRDFSPYTFLIVQGEFLRWATHRGGYLEAVLRYARQHQSGVRVEGMDDRWGVVLAQTFDPSEFSRFRFQIEHFFGERSLHITVDVQYALGPHGAHTF